MPGTTRCSRISTWLGVIELPYAGTIYKNYFQEKLGADVAVSRDVPAIRSRNQIAITTVPASSHSKPEVFQWQRLIVQCWSRDEETTSELCNRVRYFALLSKRELATVHKVRIVGEPGRFDDPDDTSPRFQLTFDSLFKTVPQSFSAAP